MYLVIRTFSPHDWTAPPAGQGLLIIEASWLHRTRYNFSGRVISSSQRPLPHNTQTSLSPARSETAIPTSEGPQTHGLGRAATWIGTVIRTRDKIVIRSRGAQIKMARLPKQISFVSGSRIFVCPQWGTSFISPSRRIEIWGGFYIFRKFVDPWYSTLIPAEFFWSS